MKITHTTHEAASGRPRHPSTATQKFKVFFSLRNHGNSHSHEDDQEKVVLTPLTSRLSTETRLSQSDQPNIRSAVAKDREDVKRRQREQKADEEARHRTGKLKTSAKRDSSGYLNKALAPRRRDFLPLIETSAPSIKRKDKSEEEFLPLIRSSSRSASTIGTVNQMHVDLVDIRAGNLEQVVPPSAASFNQNPFLSPPPSTRLSTSTRASTTSSVSASRSFHQYPTTTSHKLSSYVLSSADLLDATRHELASSLRQSAIKFSNTLDYHQRSAILDDADSDSDDESFCCIGENGSREDLLERTFAQLDKARCLSGEGTNPWIDDLADQCRLCHRERPARLRGLCKICEKELSRPRMPEEKALEEIKPTPPLKIRKTSLAPSHVKTVSASSVEWLQDPFSDANVAPPPPLKDVHTRAFIRGGKVDAAQMRPKVVPPMRKMGSLHASIAKPSEAGSPPSPTDERSRYEMWQSTELRAEYERGEKEFGRWSNSLLGEKTLVPGCAGEGQARSQTKKAKGLGLRRRDTRFYGFYDEVLIDHGAGCLGLKSNEAYQKL